MFFDFIMTLVRNLHWSFFWENDSKELAALLKDTDNPAPMGMAIVLGALAEDLKNQQSRISAPGLLIGTVYESAVGIRQLSGDAILEEVGFFEADAVIYNGAAGI
jgi:hypothetical protein